MGAWLDVYDEAIYGAKPGPLQGADGRRSTVKSDTAYLHVFDWPEGSEIRVQGVDVSATYLLADAEKSPPALRQAGEDVVISGPVEAPDAIATVVVLDV